MKEIVVLSGKGGTGKTCIAASFAVLAKNKVMADCDVDAANLNLLLAHEILEEHEFQSGQVARINEASCLSCRLCEQYCRFDAIDNCQVAETRCEGCGLCLLVCPFEAVSMHPNIAGKWFVSNTRYGKFVHARLGIAQGSSGKLVAMVRQKAKDIAGTNSAEYIITDGPPGTGCPAISSLSDADLALLVTEPTLTAHHDLERVAGLCRHFGVSQAVCINKCDLNESNSRSIEKYCEKLNIPVVGRIPVDDSFTRAVEQGIPVVEFTCNSPVKEIEKMWAFLDSRI